MPRYIATRIEGPVGSFESGSLDDIQAQMLADMHAYKLNIYDDPADSESLVDTLYFRAMRPNNPRGLGWIPFLLKLSEEEAHIRYEKARLV
ncbi:MAG: hypothetical protein HYW22_00995 [Candidatus Aenigmarchaeota archaeon]|nr:hypothetical protein [Candidatus Aenigmarchaeota archaeon]